MLLATVRKVNTEPFLYCTYLSVCLLVMLVYLTHRIKCAPPPTHHLTLTFISTILVLLTSPFGRPPHPLQAMDASL